MAKSRSARWIQAVGDARTASEAVRNAADDLASALQDLLDIKGEYEEWLGNLPENLHGSALGEKLTAVTDLDIEGPANDPLDSWADVETLLDEAEGIDLPQGFGRD